MERVSNPPALRVRDAFEWYRLDPAYLAPCEQLAARIDRETFGRKWMDVINDKADWEAPDFFSEPLEANLLILAGYELHRELLAKFSLDEEQIREHMSTVKTCFERDLKNGRPGATAVYAVWATRFQRLDVLRAGILRFEHYKDWVSIHIPGKCPLDRKNVLASIEKARTLSAGIFGLPDPVFHCDSWMLSPQLVPLLKPDSRILAFSRLFEITEGKDCTEDLLNYVFRCYECDDFRRLPEETGLQRSVKEELLKGTCFKSGKGILLPLPEVPSAF